MKKSIAFLCSLVLLFMLNSCKKDGFTSNKSASIQVINGAINVPIIVRMDGKLVNGLNTAFRSQLNFGTGGFYYSEGKTSTMDILKGTDSSLLKSNSFLFKGGSIYSLLVAGHAPAVETVLIEETNYPFVNSSKIQPDEDSVINIRFVNLCPDAQPLSIRVQGSSSFETTDLDFKEYTAFKPYPGKITAYSGTTGYSILNFEVLENGSVIKTHSMFVFFPNYRFRNYALVITGKKTPGAGEPALAVKEVAYFQ